MNDIPAQAFVLVGAIVAALIAGFFSFLNLVISKEQKVSEFRQEWINSFRREVSELVAAVFHIKFYLEAYKSDSQHEMATQLKTVASTLRESHETYARAVTSLKLRINPSEKNPRKAKMNSDFLTTFEALRNAFNQAEYSRATDLCRELSEKSIPILKSEWERVKRGERVYRTSKWIAVTVLMMGLVGTGIVASNWFSLSESLPPESLSTPANKPLQPPP